MDIYQSFAAKTDTPKSVPAALKFILGEDPNSPPQVLRNLVRFQVVPYIEEMERMLTDGTPDDVVEGAGSIHICRIARAPQDRAMSVIASATGNSSFFSDVCARFASHYTRKLAERGITVSLEASGGDHRRGDNPSAALLERRSPLRPAQP